MARISVERAHHLGLAGAREKAEALVQKLADQYGLAPRWSGDTVSLKRSGVSGEVTIAEDRIRVDVELGMLMSAMSGTIKSEIEKALDKALA
ncbi:MULTISPECIES: polyhydroxyalkanoic acid system family protein [Pseudomonas]|uniref:Putative polyhydroxyalkanoic acid system protein n=1 Tax=Pseudomonas asplenii TaxID=53407 RepID=A0A0M9GJC9_9PSED|nr:MULTISPECIES: polyhydroxyalkanoic acid system family protein [Pseudomonas]KPA92406.1 putative polyhydroxyalkanoic acid system protein [Pseudomonas fuscovaginae]KPA94935.1 putative polyhydroxyalkanoic acid system protein [Pseudomonas fuscovaginae]